MVLARSTAFLEVYSLSVDLRWLEFVPRRQWAGSLVTGKAVWSRESLLRVELTRR